MVALLGERRPVGTTAGGGASAFPRVMAPRPAPTSSSRCAKPTTPVAPAPHAPASRHPGASGCAARIAMTPPAPAVVAPTARALSTASPPRRLDRISPVVSPQRASCTPTMDDPARGRRSRRGALRLRRPRCRVRGATVSLPPNPAPCPLGEAVAALQVTMQLQPHGDTPGQKRPGGAGNPSC